jgi:hypothetical protein
VRFVCVIRVSVCVPVPPGVFLPDASHVCPVCVPFYRNSSFIYRNDDPLSGGPDLWGFE